MLSGGAAAEVLLRYDNVTFFHIFDKILINILHAVGSQFCGIGGIQISCGNDNVGIHVIPEFENCSFCVVHFPLPFYFIYISFTKFFVTVQIPICI